MGLWRSINSRTYNYKHDFFPPHSKQPKTHRLRIGTIGCLKILDSCFFSVRLSRTPSKSVVLTNQSCLGFATEASQLRIIYTYDYYYS